MGYQGWSNYETWAVNLWLENEEGSYNYWRGATQKAWGETDEKSEERSSDARSALEDRLKSEIEEGAPDLGATLWSDLMTAALGEVDWREIADSMLEGAELRGYKPRRIDTAT